MRQLVLEALALSYLSLIMTLDGPLSRNLHSYWLRQTNLVRIVETVMKADHA